MIRTTEQAYLIYVLRGIDENGNPISLDNDGQRKITYDTATKLWKYEDTGSHMRETVNLKSASCAISSKSLSPEV